MKSKSGNPQHIPTGTNMEITKVFGVARLGVYFGKYNVKCTYGFLRGQFEYRKCHPHVSWPGRVVKWITAQFYKRDNFLQHLQLVISKIDHCTIL